MKPTRSKFYKALYSEYAKVGDREAKEDDWNNAVEYADRAVKSASGGPVYPEAIEARDLPKDAAHAQGKFFDCRMEEQEENQQPKDIAQCGAGGGNGGRPTRSTQSARRGQPRAVGEVTMMQCGTDPIAPAPGWL